MGAILDADPRGGNVAGDRAVLLDVHPAAGVHVAHYLAGDDHFARVNFGIELGGGADDQFMAAQRDRAIHLPVNLQIFIASDLPFDLNASAEARRAAGSRTSKARCGRNTERNDWGRGTGRRRSGGWVCDSLRFGPHNASLIQTQRMNEAPGGKEQRELTVDARRDRKSTRLNSSHLVISYAVFCLKKKKNRV